MKINERALVLCRLLPIALLCAALCSCTTTKSSSSSSWDGSKSTSTKASDDTGFLGLGKKHDDEDGGGLFGGTQDPAEAESKQWIKDAPHSAALDPKNWLDMSAFYLGEIALAPARLVGLVLDGAQR